MSISSRGYADQASTSSLQFCDLHDHRHAQYSLGNFHDSVASYTKGLALDPNNAVMKSALSQAQLKAKEQGDVDDEDEEADEAGAPVGARGGAGAGAGGMPDLSSLAGMFGGGGGGGGEQTDNRLDVGSC